MTKDEIKTYIQSHEFASAKANSAFLVCDLAFRAYADSDKVHGEPYSPVFYFFSGEKRDYFYQIIADGVIAGVGKRIYADYLTNERTLEEKMSAHLKLEHQLDALWDEYLTLRGSKELAVFVPFFKKFIEVATKWWYYAAIGEDKGDVIRNTIVPKFAKRHKFPLADADEMFNMLSHPEEQTVLNLERELFLKICMDIADGKSPEKDIARYIKEFFWMKTDFYKAEEITPSLLMSLEQKELEEKGKSGIEQELASIKSNYKRLHDERAMLQNRIKLSSEDEHDLVFAEKTILWIDRRKLGMMKHFYYFLTFVADIAKLAGMPYAELSRYSVEDLKCLLQDGTKVKADEITKREHGIFCLQEKGKEKQVFLGSDAEELFQTYLNRLQGGGVIKGQVASKGKEKVFRGVARVVLQPDGHTFNEGEILVTSMTRVEFLSLMRKAKAIITDEGGIACHAAIISRELGIPCIIGVKVGTHALKDGDMIEMDMEKGVVKIIKKANG